MRYRVAWPTQNRNHDDGILFVLAWATVRILGRKLRARLWTGHMPSWFSYPAAVLTEQCISSRPSRIRVNGTLRNPCYSIVEYSVSSTCHEIKRKNYELLIYQIAKYHNSVTTGVMMHSSLSSCILNSSIILLATSTECRVMIISQRYQVSFLFIARLFDHR